MAITLETNLVADPEGGTVGAPPPQKKKKL